MAHPREQARADTVTLSRQIVLFVVVALLGAGVQLGTLWLLTEQADVPALPAFWAGWLAGWVHNFFWHRRAIFARRDSRRPSQAPRSFIASLAGLGVQTAVFALLIGPFHVVVAGAIASACSLPVTFLLSRQWAFRKPRTA